MEPENEQILHLPNKMQLQIGIDSKFEILTWI